MSTPNHRPAVPTLQHIHTQLREIDPSLRSATQRPFVLPDERVALDKINATLKLANTAYLEQARALYADLEKADVSQAAGQQVVTRLKANLNAQLRVLDETSTVDNQSRKTYLTFTAGISAVEQHARLNVADYLLAPSDLRMVEDTSRGPSFRPGQYALTFTYQDQTVEFAGAFILTRQSAPVPDSLVSAQPVGPVLLFTPGRGLEAFESLQALDQALHQVMTLPAGREEFIRLLPTRYQSLDTVGIWPLGLAVIEGEPLFEHVYAAQLDKRRQDIEQALSQPGTDLAARLDAAIQAALPDLSSRLDLREQQLLERSLYNSLPDWYRNANQEQKHTVTTQLHDYNLARQAFFELFAPATTPHALAHHQWVEQLADELDIHDLDPHLLLITTRRHVPGIGHYEHRRSLVELGLRGLHSGDERAGSDFLEHSTLTYAGAPLSAAHADLTPQNLINLLEDLQPHRDFAARQATRLGNPDIRKAARTLCDRRLVALAGMAKLQGHLNPADHTMFEQLRAPSPPRLRAQTVLLHGAQLKDLWLLREDDAHGEARRVLLCTPEAPRPEQFVAFNSVRACQTHIIEWAKHKHPQPGRSMHDYLLAQVPLRFRPSMQRFLLGLSFKPTANEHEEVTFGPSCSHADCLDMCAAHWLSVLQDDYEYGAPPWFRACSADDRTRLTSLAQDALGAVEQYNQWPDAPANFPSFDAFLHEKAKLSLNTLLGRRQNDIDPDRVFAYSPKPLFGQAPAPLSYTHLYRDGYEDGIGFLDAKFSTSATFRGPEGIDLSALTPQKVARSVTGVWIGRRYTDEVRKRLQAHDSPGYDARRNAALAIQQLHMKGAALESCLKGDIVRADLDWLNLAIDSLGDNSAATRTTYRVHRLVIDGDWVTGNYLFSHAAYPTLLYTPNAPDGVSFRLARLFNYLLKKVEGMPTYWCSRVPVQSVARIRTFLDEAFMGLPDSINRTTPSPARHDSIAHVSPLADLRHEFYNMPLQRQIDDVEATTTNRAQMIAAIVWTTVEWVTAVATIPFPAMSLALGGLLAFKDAMLALNAYHQGDRGAALQHYLGYLANLGGALLFDFRPALANTSAALRPARPILKGGIQAQEHALIQQLDTFTPEGMQRVLFDAQPYWAKAQPDALGRHLLYRHDPLTGQLHSSGRLVNRNADGNWIRSGVPGGGRKRYEKLLEEHTNPLSSYDIAPDQGANFRVMLDPDFKTRQPDWGGELAGAAAQDNAYAQLSPLREAYDQRVQQLTRDATLFFQSPPAAKAKTDVAPLADDIAHNQVIKTLFSREKRLIIGAAETVVASRALLIDSLPDLATAGLKRVYIENLPRDLFHRKLKVLNNELKGNQAKALQSLEQHLARVDLSLGLAADGPFTYRRLLRQAHAQGIAIDGLDGSASYHMEHVLALGDGPRFIPRASTLRNYYSYNLIRHNAQNAPNDGWIALVEPSRMGTYEQVPGLAQLHDTLALRVEDVAPGQPVGVSQDTFASAQSRGDYRLAQTAIRPALALSATATATTSTPAAVTHFDRFDVPLEHRRVITQMTYQHRALDTRYYPARESHQPPFQAFVATRTRLQEATKTFFAHYTFAPRTSPAYLATATSEPSFIERVYTHKQGLVIGEPHTSASSKHFLIKHMKLLKKQGVQTLYLEHLLTDLHQEALTTFHTTLKMPQHLADYLDRLDRGQMPGYRGDDTFTNVVKAANKYGIRVRALDCTASYHIKGLGENPRHSLFSFFANEVIKADQLAVGPHKWVAFMGTAHTDMHVLVPGLADLQDTVSLHIRDTTPALARPLHRNGWEIIDDHHGVALRSDFKIDVGTPGKQVAHRAPGPDRNALKEPGQFLIDRRSPNQVNLVHRSRNRDIVTTPIQINEKGQYFIERWDTLKDSRFLYLTQLIQALKANPPQGIGLTQVL